MQLKYGHLLSGVIISYSSQLKNNKIKIVCTNQFVEFFFSFNILIIK